MLGYVAFDARSAADPLLEQRAEAAMQDVLPQAVDGAHILRMAGRDVFTAYVPSQQGPVFMTLIGKTFGSDVTTRTWETVRKCAAA